MGYVGYGLQVILRMLRIRLGNGDHQPRMNGLNDLHGRSLLIIVTQIHSEVAHAISNMLRRKGMFVFVEQNLVLVAAVKLAT